MKLRVLVCITHQAATQQALTIGADDQLLVNAFDQVLIDDRTFRRGKRIPKTRYVNTHQLELGRHVGTSEPALPSAQLLGHDVRHLVAWTDQTEDQSAVKCTFSNRKDAGVVRAELIVDHDAATLPDTKARVARQVVAGTDTRRDHDHVDVESLAVGET